MARLAVSLSLVIVLLLAGSVYSLDTSVQTDKSKKVNKEKSQTIKKSKEVKDTKGNRMSDTKTVGEDKIKSDTLKEVEQALTQSALTIEVPVENIIFPLILEKEKGQSRFSSCRLLSSPVTLRDVKLDLETFATGVSNDPVYKIAYVTKASELLAMAASRDSKVPKDYPEGSGIDRQSLIKGIANCMHFYGTVIAGTYDYLLTLTSEVGASVDVRRRENRTDETAEIGGVGYADIVKLLPLALEQAISAKYEKPQLSDCYFRGAIDKYQCGEALVTITPNTLTMYGVPWYGNAYAGKRATIRISKNWSLQDAIERLKTVSKYSKWAEEVSNYAEHLESQGKVKEAATVRKKALEIAKTGKQTVPPTNLHQ